MDEVTTSADLARRADGDSVYIFGVKLDNYSQDRALAWLRRAMQCGDGVSRGVFIVNAHTLNLACESAAYRATLSAAARVFADGTGVRWAASRRGRPLKANLVGTDLVPALFDAAAGHGLRYFLLGADAPSVRRAAAYCQQRARGWQQVGFHHGYLDDAALDAAVVAQINAARPHLLLVAMGNPRQERWIAAHLDRLQVPVSVGVGGLFDHWAGNLRRAPRWVRHCGYEWLQLLLQQPHKWRRYLLGNPAFLWRMFRYGRDDRTLTERDV